MVTLHTRVVPLGSIERRKASAAREAYRNEIALRAIRRGIDRATIMGLLDLSASAYERLAGQARAA